MEGRLSRDAEKTSACTASVSGGNPRANSPVRRLSGPQRRWAPRPQSTLDRPPAHSRFRPRYPGAGGHTLDVYKRMDSSPGLHAVAPSGGWGRGGILAGDLRQDHGQIPLGDPRVRVIRPEAPLEDLHRPPHQRLGLGKTVCVLEQQSQVVEISGNIGVFAAEGSLVDI